MVDLLQGLGLVVAMVSPLLQRCPPCLHYHRPVMA
jgi:hypothetical protein